MSEAELGREVQGAGWRGGGAAREEAGLRGRGRGGRGVESRVSCVFVCASQVRFEALRDSVPVC